MPRDHYVPQFYLKAFAQATHKGGQGFWVYDKERPGARFQTPINTTVISDLYSMPEADGGVNRQLEGVLADLEGKVAPVFERWQTPRARPEASELELMAYFLALTHMRVPRQIGAAQEFGDVVVREEMKELRESDNGRLAELLESHRRETGEDLASPKEIRAALDRVGHRVSANPKRAVLDSLALAGSLAEELVSRTNWCLCSSHSYPLLTSDSPVCVFSQDKDGLALFGSGFGLPNVEISYPVSPSICLLIDRQHRVGHMAISTRRTKELNRRAAWNAERFVISSVQARGVDRLVQACSRTRSTPKIDPEAATRLYREAKRRTRTHET